MATVYKLSPRGIDSSKRAMQYVATTDFVLNDVIDVERGLGRPARYIEITTAADATITLRFNSMTKHYPLHPDGKRLDFYAPDLSQETEYLDTTAYSQDIGNGETVKIYMEELGWTIKNLEVTALTVGSGVTIWVK